MQLSKNFELTEFLKSAYSNKYKEQLNPPQQIIDKLDFLSNKILQPARDFIGSPIKINSGYRCWNINKAVGGSATSQHPRGEAVDIELPYCPDLIKNSIIENVKKIYKVNLKKDNLNDNFYIFLYFLCNIKLLSIGQLIHEYGSGIGKPSLVHVSSESDKNKKQILIINKETTKLVTGKELLEMI